MINLLKIAPLLLGAKIGVDVAKDVGLFSVNMLSMTNRAINWKKTREYQNWLTDILNPNSDFFKVRQLQADPPGVWTVGWGITNQMNDYFPDNLKVKTLGQRFTKSEIEEQYNICKKHFEDIVKRYLNGLAVPQGVFDACTSVAYNTGAGLFINNGNETQFYKALKRKDWEGARLNLTWFKSAGQIRRGIVARRMGEHSLFLGMTPKSHEYYLQYWEQFLNSGLDKKYL